MGLLVEGQWQDKWYDTKSTGGHFKRSESQFRNWVTADGEAGPTGEGGFPAESGRYHLYVSYACPWAHRALVMRAWKGLEKHIDVSVVHPLMLEHGWELREDFPGATGDPLYGLDKLYQLYLKADGKYTGRVTVPVLWDKQRGTIVNNESADIIRMLNSAFDGVGGNALDLYPTEQQATIDELNAWIYPRINNGVYRAGFATSQAAYSEAVSDLFAALDTLEQRLSGQRYLTGAHISEADWRLFTTLIRFDAVYVGHFKCNLREIRDYLALSAYLRDLYQQPGIADTVDIDYIKEHYYRSQPTVNPSGVIPLGPSLDFSAPHGREHLTA